MKLLSRLLLLTVVTICLPFGVSGAVVCALEMELRGIPKLYRDAWNGEV